MVDYTDSQKAQNFKFILDAIHYIRNNGRITEDWMETHKKQIKLYRDYFGDFNVMNPECTDRRFRMLAADTEMTLNHLIWEITETGYFTVDVYLKLNTNLKRMMETFYDMDDVCDLFNQTSQLG